MAKDEEIEIISSCLGGLNGYIKNAKSPKAVQQEILKYVSSLNTSLKTLHGFAPPPLRLDKLEANASNKYSMKAYVNKYFSRWPKEFTEKVDDHIAGGSDFDGCKTAYSFVMGTLVTKILLLQKASAEETLKQLQTEIRNDITNFNAKIALVSAEFKTLANDRKKGSALYYLNETKKTGNDSIPPKDTKKTEKTEKDSNTPENTIKAFIKFLQALAKEFRKEKKLQDNIKLLQKKLEKMKNKN